ncbi:DUF3080 family protein [Marinomonas sp. 5E14-1]|uniref:DUF3080 family protein n=1 Tax=Marinomonas sp. 5E14-1 TaxID=3153922 RepID=UPI003265ECDD
MLVKPFLSMILLGGIILIGVSGCDTRFKAETTLSDYVQDLNRSQFFSTETPAIVMPNRLPPKRLRQLDLSAFDIGLLDFLSLQQCGVGAVAGKKNSILGKVMPDSQRFLYELDIIRAIESCEVTDRELAESLYQVAQKKRLELPIAFGNAIFQGEESDAFFSLSNGFLPLNYSKEHQQELLNALNHLIVIGENLESLPVVDGDRFENDLKALLNSEYAGRLLYSLSRITSYLNQVSKETSALDQKACGAPMAYLSQQFERHYVKALQPYMGRINSSAYEVLPLLNRLAELGKVSNETRVFMHQFSLQGVSRSVWLDYQEASQKHAKQWSRVFGLCSIPLSS